MAIQPQMVDNHIKAEDAKKAAEDAKKNAALGNPVTKRGTRIVKSNGEMDMNSFLTILAAQMKNLDPTGSSGQDSTAQVTQMAQFSSMGVMQNLNNTMTDSARNDMVGKRVILNQKDSSGNYITGVVNKVIKKLGDTFYNIDVNGQEREYRASNVIGVNGSDTNTMSNYRSALNTDFVAASTLGGKNVVLSDVDENKKPVLVKGKVVGVYLDTVNGAGVKVKIGLLDDKGELNGKSKVYDYSSIVRAGDLEAEEMKVEIPATGEIGTIGNSTTGVAKPISATGKDSDEDAPIYYDRPQTETDKEASSTDNGTNDSKEDNAAESAESAKGA